MSPLQKLNAVLDFPNFGLLLLRLWLGVEGFYHGGQKLFGLFDGPGISGFAGWLGSMNVPAPQASAVLAGLAEFGGGLLVALGLFTRPAALVFAINMLTAIALVHTGAFDNANQGLEFPMTLAVALLTLVFTGPGRLSVDSFIGRGAARPRP
jgi:putative oxidoreductase